ncbi:unnamed protein product [Aphanomyces euteiches]|uniref:6-phosphogluconate dehydrogenase NADP-binding domain-containing protein n=1 Tax=Aphanomyces euteiches TaxID=100861 RepID=A0A6G0XNX6_9STRA|nr:hypothetical protein Ae201684_002965 [Aphanomyces euteiches]KAH9093316.1 hypothetical protein Ae201684P_008972 [Aphanomyces euteiches]KAH9153608.1 hypothetical protein AeRB84_004173 [Aphanomyces euteiches]
MAALRVGFIGAGIMGKSMCGHILNGGFPVTTFSRTPSKCQSLVDKGARLAASPAEVALHSDVLFTIVGYPHDVRQVILGEQGVLSQMQPGGIIVDMTTSEPSLAKEIFHQAKLQGVSSIDAPVSGGDIGAREARLSIMAGGEPEAIDRVMPLFKLLGTNIRHMGGPGAGQHTKMVNQILIATNMIGVVEGLLYAYKSGLDLHETIAAVGAGAAGSWSIKNLGPRIANRDFDPGFMVEHFIKDLGIALKESQAMGLSLPGLALANQFYLAVQAVPNGPKLGTQALMLAFEKMNSIQP